MAIISSVVAAKYSGSMSRALEGSPLPADLQAVASDSVGATYEVAAKLQASGRATAEQADALRAAADAAFIPAFHVAAYMALALLLIALVIILVWLPAQAEAVAWKAGGTSAPLPGSREQGLPVRLRTIPTPWVRTSTPRTRCTWSPRTPSTSATSRTRRWSIHWGSPRATAGGS